MDIAKIRFSYLPALYVIERETMMYLWLQPDIFVIVENGAVWMGTLFSEN